MKTLSTKRIAANNKELRTKNLHYNVLHPKQRATNIRSASICFAKKEKEGIRHDYPFPSAKERWTS